VKNEKLARSGIKWKTKN